MTIEAENPPAFPAAITCTAAGDVYHGLPGMTLRDWFAGQALAGAASNPSIWDASGTGISLERNRFWVAQEAYALADAMLSVRHPTQEQG